MVNSLGIGDTNDVDEVGVVETVMDTRLHKNGARQDIEDIMRLIRMMLLYEDKNAVLITERVTIA